ncbi:MAG: hypothetical protein ACK4UX_12770 [Thiobacillus sp.]
MSPVPPLAPERLSRPCDTSYFPFSTTAELDDLAAGIGQLRAIEAAHFGIGMRHAGYNLYQGVEIRPAPPADLAGMRK